MSSGTALWTEFKVQAGLYNETLSQNAKSIFTHFKMSMYRKTTSGLGAENRRCCYL